jgi:preprotein translocase subunit SecG
MNFWRSWQPCAADWFEKAMLHWILTILQFVCALMIILLVLVQRGKGAEAGAGFGAGASGTVFGARGAGTALSRATAILAAVFMLNSLALAYVGSRTVTAAPKTLLDTAGKPVAPLRGLPGPSAPTGTGAPPAPGFEPSGSTTPAPTSAAPSAPSSAPASTGAPAAHTPADSAPKQ